MIFFFIFEDRFLYSIRTDFPEKTLTRETKYLGTYWIFDDR